MDLILLGVAFLFGLAAQQLRLPPLVGFLIAGFVLKALGQTGGEWLEQAAEVGVTLMLFTIGVKLKPKTLARPEIWAGTSLHTLLTMVGVSLALLGVSLIAGESLGLDWKAALLIAFGLSFSSTVFAVKSLQEAGGSGAMHGRITIGILVMQDILAVLFLTFSTGKIPSIWAVPLLIALVGGRKILGELIRKCGHGELVALCGLFLALIVGAKGFDIVGLKADLGALFVGVLVGNHPKAKEVSKSLNGVIDILLIGFFLQIGLEGTLSAKGIVWGLLVLALLPLKGLAFFAILTRFKLRARTAWIASLNLSTYSEFGLIVTALSVSQGWLSPDWLTATAIALSLSLLIIAPLSRRAEEIYDPISGRLKRFETPGRHPDDVPISLKNSKVAIFGMGPMGLAAYDKLSPRFRDKITGFDRDPDAVKKHQEAGRNVLLADATDSDFWERITIGKDIEVVVLAMPNHQANIETAKTLKRHNFNGIVSATARFDDEVTELQKLGVDVAFNIYAEAGAGLANHIHRSVKT